MNERTKCCSKKEAQILLYRLKESFLIRYEQHLLFPNIQVSIQKINEEHLPIAFVLYEFYLQFSQILRDYVINLTPKPKQWIQQLRQYSFIKYNY